MQILQLQIDNFKRLRAVQIDPRGQLVQVTGRNAQGKSSVLDAISAALSGTRSCPSDPIRHGSKTATIKLDMGDLVVTRKFTEGGGSLTVTNADGMTFPSPQKMLDAMLGEIAFDPLAFSRMKARDQFDQLKDVARVDLDLEKLEQLNRSDFDRRTDLNRDAKQLRAQIEGLPAVPGGTDIEPRDVNDLVQAVEDLRTMRSDAVQERDDRRRKESEVERKRARIAALRQEAEGLMAEVKDLRTDLEKPLGTDEPSAFDGQIGVLQEMIRTAQSHNEMASTARNNAQRRQDLEAQAKVKEEASRVLSEQLDARQRAKEDALAKAEFPVPGLSLGEGQVLFNGVPLSQASSAEQLRISTALAMAANPKVKVILIREGSLLDQDGLCLVAEMAEASGFQVWLEKVDSSKHIGVVIEDGSVLVDNQVKEDQP